MAQLAYFPRIPPVRVNLPKTRMKACLMQTPFSRCKKLLPESNFGISDRENFFPTCKKNFPICKKFFPVCKIGRFSRKFWQKKRRIGEWATGDRVGTKEIANRTGSPAGK
jgi:hypothetical protein